MDRSRPFDNDNVFAAIVERTTVSILDEFQQRGHILLFPSVRKSIWLALLPPLCRLLKLASVKSLIFKPWILSYGNYIP